MIVILEGADGSGKTTLWKQLQEAGYGTLLIYPHNKELFDWENAKIMFADTTVICDRSFISDLVYRLHDKKSRRGMTLKEMCTVLDYGVKIIYLSSGSEFEDSVKRGEDNIITKKDSNNIKKLYKLIMSMFNIFSNVPIMRYNWKKQNVQDVIKFIGKEDE